MFPYHMGFLHPLRILEIEKGYCIPIGKNKKIIYKWNIQINSVLSSGSFRIAAAIPKCDKYPLESYFFPSSFPSLVLVLVRSLPEPTLFSYQSFLSFFPLLFSSFFYFFLPFPPDCLPSFFLSPILLPFLFFFLILFLPFLFPLFFFTLLLLFFLSFLPLFYSPGFFLLFPSSIFLVVFVLFFSSFSQFFLLSIYFTSLLNVLKHAN